MGTGDIKIGKAIVVAGRRGSGKTTDVRKLVKMVPENNRLIYDVNGEYSDLYKQDFEDFKVFNERAKSARNAFIVFEEATIYFGNRGYNSGVTDMLVKARHRGNTIVFVYHSLRAIPVYIFDLCTHFILHKTNDSPDIVKRFKNDNLDKAYKQVKDSMNPYTSVIKSVY